MALDLDRALSSVVAALDEPITRTALVLLSATGMRIGELLDLELDCLLDFAEHGTWLKVPLDTLRAHRPARPGHPGCPG